MAKRKVRRERRLAALGIDRREKPKLIAGAVCEAEDCGRPGLEQVYLEDLDRKVTVCSQHGAALRIQIERNENVKAGQAHRDRQLLEQKLGLS